MKSNKQKCLEMWEWLAENPTQGKIEYYQHLLTVGREDEFYHCWACEEDELMQRRGDKNCVNCPIAFPLNSKGIKSCMEKGSPYSKWFYAHSEATVETATQAMVELIKTTWKENQNENQD